MSALAELNRYRVVERFAQQKCAQQGWLDSAGNFRFEGSPLSNLWSRPTEWYDPDAQYLQTSFIHAQTSKLGKAPLQQGEQYQLDIDVRQQEYYC